jgi:hypothetical protein
MFNWDWVFKECNVQWNLCNPTPEFTDILLHRTKIYGPKVFLLNKVKPEYCDILYNPTDFPGPLVCRIRLVPLYYHLSYCNQYIYCLCKGVSPVICVLCRATDTDQTHKWKFKNFMNTRHCSINTMYIRYQKISNLFVFAVKQKKVYLPVSIA